MEVFSSRIHEWFLKGPSKGYSLSRPFLPLCQSSKDFIPSKEKLTGIGPFTGKAVGQAVGMVHEVKEWRSLRGKSGRRNQCRAGKPAGVHSTPCALHGRAPLSLCLNTSTPCPTTSHICLLLISLCLSHPDSSLFLP